MQNEGTYRHEMKYKISAADYMVIRHMLQPVMKTDRHAGEDGRYTVRSIYFDNADDQALREKRNGVARREKFRIRYYNDEFSFFMLEKKVKWNNLCMKTGAGLTQEECRKLLSGDTQWMPGHPCGLVRELYQKRNICQLRPRVLVSYEREAYVYAVGNVRVTLDSKIRSTLFHCRFLEETVADISVSDGPDDVILEVKFDAFLPDVIRSLLQTGDIRQQAYSKYGACRRFG